MPSGSVHTGSSALVAYGFESTFGGGTSETRMFGKEQKINSLELNEGQTALAELYSPEVVEFYYKKEQGGCTVDYILSNPWVFGFILNDAVYKAGGAMLPNEHLWDSDPDLDETGNGYTARATSTRELCSGHLEFWEEGFASMTNGIDRNAKGVICPSMNIKTSIDQPVKVNQQLVWGIEDDIITTIGGDMPDAPLTTAGQITDSFPPYTFANGSLKLPVAGGDLANVQDIDITFDTGGELLYGIQDTPKAVSNFRKMLNITGRITIPIKDKTFVEAVQDRGELVDMELEFDNGLTDDGEKSILMTFTGVGLSKHQTNGLAPGELLTETFDFQCRKVRILAKNNSGDQFV